MKTIFLHGEIFESFHNSSFAFRYFFNVDGKGQSDTPLVYLVCINTPSECYNLKMHISTCHLKEPLNYLNIFHHLLTTHEVGFLKTRQVRSILVDSARSIQCTCIYYTLVVLLVCQTMK